jgi:hypothetical protein
MGHKTATVNTGQWTRETPRTPRFVGWLLHFAMLSMRIIQARPEFHSLPLFLSDGPSCGRGTADIVSASCELGLGLGLCVLYVTLHEAFLALLGGFFGHLNVLACC